LLGLPRRPLARWMCHFTLGRPRCCPRWLGQSCLGLGAHRVRVLKSLGEVHRERAGQGEREEGLSSLPLSLPPSLPRSLRPERLRPLRLTARREAATTRRAQLGPSARRLGGRPGRPDADRTRDSGGRGERRPGGGGRAGAARGGWRGARPRVRRRLFRVRALRRTRASRKLLRGRWSEAVPVAADNCRRRRV